MFRLLSFLVPVLALATAPRSLPAQQPKLPSAISDPATNGAVMGQAVDLEISVRDAHGNVIDSDAVIHLTSSLLKVYRTASTQSASPARFHGLAVGEYDLEVTCPGFQTVHQHLALESASSLLPMYLYLIPESDASKTGPAPAILAPQLRPDMERALEDLRRGHYAAAQKKFTKLVPRSHDNPDVLYNLGLSELGLQHTDLARRDFQRALAGDPTHELALVSLAQMELHNDSPAAALPFLEKAVSSGVASWRAHYDLATAYLKLNRLGEAEAAASRAVQLSNKQPAPIYLLGQIQYAEGKRSDAKTTWQSLVNTFPSDPLAAQATKDLARPDFTNVPSAVSVSPNSVSPTPELPPVVVEEHPWAPPDVDRLVPPVAPSVTCNPAAVLNAALSHMKSQLLDFEKFTATEHVEHQDIDRHGWPGPTDAHDFSYIVFVNPLGRDSLFVQESRDGNVVVTGFHDAFTTTSLISLGVNILQPYYRDRFAYSCEGLAQARGQAAWQLHFVQKPAAKEGIRTWKDNKKTWDIPLKGRIWISSVNCSVLRIETDLREPINDLQLTKDHLIVEYGPVNFAGGAQQLWLPWKADMFVEFRGKRYHHRHTLTNYFLFSVETTQKVKPPPEEYPH